MRVCLGLWEHGLDICTEGFDSSEWMPVFTSTSLDKMARTRAAGHWCPPLARRRSWSQAIAREEVTASVGYFFLGTAGVDE